MYLSMSYFATASTIRSVPSTWTSSRSKFLGNVQLAHVEGVLGAIILRRIVTSNEIVNDVRMSNTFLDRFRISQVILLEGSELVAVLPPGIIVALP
jgi:hypothetical protein